MKDFSTKDLALMCYALSLRLGEYMACDANHKRLADMCGLMANASGLLHRAQSIGLLHPAGKKTDVSFLNVPGVYSP